MELAPFARAVAEAELGSATRFEAVWAEAAPWFKKRAGSALRPLIVIIGDGGLTEGQAKPFASARALGVEVAALNLAERGVSRGMRAGVLQTGGIVIDAGAEAESCRARARSCAVARALERAIRADAGAREHERERPARRARAAARGRAARMAGSREHVCARIRKRAHALRERGRARSVAGARSAHRTRRRSRKQTRTVRARRNRRARPRLAARAEWPEPPKTRKAACDRRGPARSHSGISSDALPVALAEERVCKPAPKAQVAANDAGAEIGSGMPSDPLLSMLRQRIMPIARGCFRRDRAGRAEYQKRAVFVFALAEREVVDAHVEGPIPDSLRQCLLAAVDTLEVPRFSGVVKARYPLVTESVPLPEQIELRSETAGKLDRLFPGSRKPVAGSLDGADLALHTPPSTRAICTRDRTRQYASSARAEPRRWD